jgi:hypothetical protein
MLTELLQDLEIFDELMDSLTPILGRFSPINFQGSVFVDSVFFSGIHFEGADFSDCRFRSKAIFEFCKFSGIAYFLNVHFDDEVQFTAEFLDEARFDFAEFSSELIFSILEKDAWFVSAKFHSWVSFSLAAGARLRLDEAQVSTIIFNRSTVPLDGFGKDSGGAPDNGTVKDPISVKAMPPLISFHGSDFTGKSEIRTRGDVDISLAGVVLDHPLSVSSWNGTIRILSLRQSILNAMLVIGDGVELGGCRMTHATGLDRLKIVQATPGWPNLSQAPGGGR